jgi:drug/metabolite transporter (DMT)-like permease
MEDHKHRSMELKGYLFALGSTAIWSGNFIIARGLNQSISPISLAFWRWLLASIVILPFAAKHIQNDWQAIKKNIPYLTVTSFLAVTLFNTLIYFAGRSTTAINLSLISITFPIFIVVMSRIFFHDPITFRKTLGIILVAAGIIYLITKGEPEKVLDIKLAAGDLLMLIAALTFATYSILLKRKPASLGIWSFQASTFIMGTVFLTPWFLMDRLSRPALPMSVGIALAILYVGILASLVAFFMWSKAVETLGPSRAGMLYYTLPLFSGLWSFLFLGEMIGYMHLISILLIIPGILIANSKSKVLKPKGKKP